VSGFQLTKNAVRQRQATGGERKAAIITAEVPLATKDDYIREITSLWNDARQRFLLIGRYLNRAKEQLPHGEFQAMLRAELPFSEQVAFQMRSVAAAIDEGRFAEGELPQNYSVAYQLVTLAEQEIEVAREKKIIRPDVRRAEIIAFKRSLRPPRSVTARHEKGLCAERERLLARLREIDILLSRKTIEATEFTVLQELDDEE
jgi:Protein of unknown function (DUF3102)